MTNVVNISGIDKVELLRKLWDNISPAGFFGGSMSPPFDGELAKNAVNKYIDYFSGRCIKTDLSGNTANPCLYDRDAGQGAFKRIVDELR